MRIRRVALGLTLVLAAVPLGAVAQADPVDAVLRTRAAAVLSRDEAAFRRTMAGAPDAFVAQRLRWFAGMRALPIDVYRLERDLDGPASFPARRRAGFDETTIIAVLETLGLRAYDAGAPQVLERFYTLGRRGTTWSVIDDAELADVGLEPAKDLWDLGAVQVRTGEGILVVTRAASASRAATFIDEIDAARDAVGRAWPFGAPSRIVALIPGSPSDLRELFAAEFDVERFIGFASSTWARRDGAVHIGGRRLVVNPRGFFRASAAGRADILRHEVLHLAANPTTGIMVPAWLEEGLAQVYGERSPRSTTAIRGRRVSVPDDYVFASGTDAQVSRAYQASLSFVRFLVRRHGRAAVARFQRDLGSISAVTAGTPDYHLDRASRRVFAEGFAGMVRAWQAEVRKGRT